MASRGGGWLSGQRRGRRAHLLDECAVLARQLLGLRLALAERALQLLNPLRRARPRPFRCTGCPQGIGFFLLDTHEILPLMLQLSRQLFQRALSGAGDEERYDSTC